MANVEALINRLEKAEQSHLLRFYDELDDNQKQNLLSQLENLDIEEINKLFKNALSSLQETVKKLDDKMEPIPPSQFESRVNSSPEQLEKYRSIGLKEISEGRVCALLLGGGQGTRLGVSYPKIMYSVGLPSGKSLCQIQAERILKLQEMASSRYGKNCKIPWYIMTSGPSREATEKFLRDNKFFGLDEDDVVFFEQGVLPCFDMNGKILLETKSRISFAPDGNGGIYRALYQSGVLNDMGKRGIDYIHVYSVDNILVKVADPIFIGYCVSKNADCGAKTVSKQSPTEAVGVVCRVDGKFQVVEYSEITEKTASLRDDKENLIFKDGNICNHFFTVTFLRRIGEKHENNLKLHVAKKKIPYVNDQGETVKPNAPNGIKIEKFIFDVFEYSKFFVTWEVPRDSEFSALKNSDDIGKECPSTARQSLFNLHKKYIENAGGQVEGNVVEISPLLSYEGEDLESLVKGKKFKEPVLLQHPSEQHVKNGSINGC
ncbi:UDP-N-acetylhexosamine pyrophosphorylase [Agrilus planipennis]|uniref:UDP-N-acetylglucosamine diphosphorylase n=1 Tax=Agrilus planipennis TaxID=224129 RepID=A0A1W4WFB7_AGRPL|nr:UDP-N-acetylhexosamine pyrophosphorylase [Agrilus planipennis]